jgi:hypothetical protein
MPALNSMVPDRPSPGDRAFSDRSRSSVVLLGLAPIARSSPSSKAHQKSGSFPPPALPGFISTMALSDARRSRRPMAALRPLPLPRRASPANPHCLASVLCLLPRRTGAGRFPVLPPLRTAFPVAQAGRHPHRYFRGLLRLHSRYGPLARSAALWRPLSQGSGRFSYPNQPPVSYSINRLTIEVESSSTGNTRRRGALCKIANRQTVQRAQRRDCDFAHAVGRATRRCTPYIIPMALRQSDHSA